MLNDIHYPGYTVDGAVHGTVWGQLVCDSWVVKL